MSALTVQSTPRYAVVLSHDCEFNDRKRTNFIAARLQDIPKKQLDDPEQLEVIRRGNNVRASVADGTPIALDSFVVDPVLNRFETPMVVNFASATPFPIKYRDDYLHMKRAEMTHDVRSLFREKIAYFFGRPADDVPDEYKVDPPVDPAQLTWTEIPVSEDAGVSTELPQGDS